MKQETFERAKYLESQIRHLKSYLKEKDIDGVKWFIDDLPKEERKRFNEIIMLKFLNGYKKELEEL